MNPIITESDFRKLKTTAGRAFLFYGEEDYLKTHAIKTTRERICPDPSFAFFNDITLDVLDFTPDKLLDAMTPPPMMTEEKLIVIRGLNFNTMKPTETDALCEALALLPEYDYNTVILHVASESIDEGYSVKRPSTIIKKLSETVTPVYFQSPGDARLATWAGKHFAHLGVTVSPADCAVLVSHVGKSMYMLANEIEKVAYYVLENGRKLATSEDILLVTVRGIDMEAFALSNAILDGKTAGALEALSVMKFERTKPEFIMGELSTTLCNMLAVRHYVDGGKSIKEISKLLGGMHEYKVELLMKAVRNVPVTRLSRAVELCAEADAAIKNRSSEYEAIEKLICSL